MKNDALYGPPKEMFKNKRTELEVKKIEEKREYESDGDFKLDENDDGNNLAQLRKYEVNKMKYYYAIVYCSSKKTAKRIYKEYNNYELELTNLRLNLSFVDDSLTFP